MYIVSALLTALLCCASLCAQEASNGRSTAWPNSHVQQETASNGTRTNLYYSLNSSCDSNHTCPVGFYCNNTTPGDETCECLDTPEQIVECEAHPYPRVAVLDCHCVTYDFESEVVMVGSCPYNCGRGTGTNKVYGRLPLSTKVLNDYICGPYNRTGPLCGRCLPGHYPSVNPFSMRCFPCPYVRWNWFRYNMAAYLPLTAFCAIATLFYFFTVYLNVNIVFSYLYPVIFCSQVLLIPALYRLLFEIVQHSPVLTRTMNAFLSLYGIWNLDFFRPYLLQGVCLGLDTLSTISLDYALAVYPVFVLGPAYILLVLVKTLARRQWNINKHAMNIFAAYYLLSNTKFLSVSFDLLTPVKVYGMYPDHYNYTLHVYIAGDMRYFGKEHLFYAAPAIVMLCASVVLPAAIVLLYFLRSARFYTLRSLADGFQGCFRNGRQCGTTHDYRWFACLYFLVRYTIFAVSACTNGVLLLVVCAILLSVLSLAIMIIRPYKFPKSRLNVINGLFLQLLAVFFLSLCAIKLSDIYNVQYSGFFYTLCCLILVCPLLYAAVLVLYWLVLLGMGARHTIRRRQDRYVELPTTPLNGVCVSERGDLAH